MPIHRHLIAVIFARQTENMGRKELYTTSGMCHYENDLLGDTWRYCLVVFCGVATQRPVLGSPTLFAKLVLYERLRNDIL